MHQSQYLAIVGLFAFSPFVSALPLNINLGAYSPAIVVGDGEISLGGKESVSQLMGALQGAAVTASGGTTTAKSTTDTAATVQGTTNSAQLATGAGLGNDLEPKIRPRDSFSSIAKRMVKDATAEHLVSRDLAGFDRALTYATTALTIGPEVQLGTGAEGSGVGILVKAGSNNGAAKGKAAAKRDVKEEKRAKVTTLFVREIPDTAEDSAISKRDATHINVDVSKARTLAMTFVEEV